MNFQQYRIAEVLSIIFSAPLFAIYLFIIIIILDVIAVCSVTELLLIIFLGVIFLLIVPVLPIIHDYRRGSTDIYVSEREKRPKYFMIAICGYFTGSVIFYFLDIIILSIFLLCYGTVTTSIFLANLITKVSVHTAGIAGPTTFMLLWYGYIFGLLYLILIPVGWSRYSLKAHNVKQLIIGAIIAVAVTFLTVLSANLLRKW
mgnify:CR=1 FL=1